MGVDISGRKPTTNEGDYFGSNWWGWRPIVQLCERVDSIYGLNLNFDSWGSNDGAGLETQKECDKLAAGLERFTSKIDWVDDEDWMGIYTECWSTLKGGFVDNNDEEIQKLNSEYEYGDVIRQSIVLPSGKVVEPAHKTYKCRIDAFIKFLKECGGFSIW
jgi:hypothetical protein